VTADGNPKQAGRQSFSFKDVDAGARADILRMLALSSLAGVVTVPVSVRYQLGVLASLGLFVGAWGFSLVIVLMIRGGASGLVMASVAPSGRTTPYKHDYSQAKAYAVQGKFAEAAHVFAFEAAEHPEDPEPCIQLARIYRDELKELDKSVEWFRQALGLATDVKTQNILIREIVEVFTNKMGESRRALPDLARFAARHEGTPTGNWARAEMAEIKKELSWET
jgi:hypothetical protein